MFQTQRRQFNDLAIGAARGAIVTEALSWRGTPYHKNGLAKFIGVDCATFPFLVYVACGLIPEDDVAIFQDATIVPRNQDWFCNVNDERYSRVVIRYLKKVVAGMSYPRLGAQPGDLALTKAGDSPRWNHSGIVLRWPKIIHCTSLNGVCVDDASTHEMWGLRQVEIYDPIGDGVPGA